MSDKNNQESQELALLKRIDGKLDTIQQDMAEIERRAVKKAVVYGAAAGASAGAIAACGILVARIKLGL